MHHYYLLKHSREIAHAWLIVTGVACSLVVNDIDSTTAAAVMHVWRGIFVDITVEVVVVGAVGNG